MLHLNEHIKVPLSDYMDEDGNQKFIGFTIYGEEVSREELIKNFQDALALAKKLIMNSL